MKLSLRSPTICSINIIKMWLYQRVSKHFFKYFTGIELTPLHIAPIFFFDLLIYIVNMVHGYEILVIA